MDWQPVILRNLRAWIPESRGCFALKGLTDGYYSGSEMTIANMFAREAALRLFNLGRCIAVAGSYAELERRARVYTDTKIAVAPSD